MQENYLQWLSEETPTTWWHDSADPVELEEGLLNRATGVTTNPVLISKLLQENKAQWDSEVGPLPVGADPEQRAETYVKHIVQHVARKLLPQHENTGGNLGYVCAQVNPARAADREAMLAMAKRFHAWAPNIAVKLPVTAAGLDVLEECAALGITVTATVSFTVPQVVAVAERYERGLEQAKQAGKKTGRCFAVIMIGRLDDFLRDVAGDRKTDVSESDIRQAGLAVTKRAYSIYKERDYKAELLVAALRGTYHMVELAGGHLIMSIHPKYQKMLLEPGVPCEQRIATPVSSEAIARLQTIPEFVRSYEPDGMKPDEFISFGVVQRTLTQFSVAGWSQLESA